MIRDYKKKKQLCRESYKSIKKVKSKVLSSMLDEESNYSLVNWADDLFDGKTRKIRQTKQK